MHGNRNGRIYFHPRLLLLQSSSEALVHPWSVSVLESSVYWSDWSQSYSTIYKDNSLVGGDPKLVSTVHMVGCNIKLAKCQYQMMIIIIFQQYKPLSLKAYHSVAQPNHKNLCKAKSSSCSHLCLVSSDLKPKCMCPRNFVMAEESECVPTTKTTMQNNTMHSKKSRDTNSMSQLVFISIIAGSSAVGVLILWLVIFFSYKHFKKRDSTENNVNIEMEKRKNEDEAEVGAFKEKFSF